MRIGVTGGIGSGKSYVCRLLAQHWQMPVYDCDHEAKRLMNTSQTLCRQLKELIGEHAYDADGHIDKTVMSRYLFSDAAHVRAINAIVHPAVKSDFEAWAARHEGDVVMESAILVEAGLRDAVDLLIVIDAPLTLRLQRAMLRDGATEEQIRARIRHQMSPAALREQADYIVVNDGRSLMKQLTNIIHSINKIQC